jgi:perosamine synthetase
MDIPRYPTLAVSDLLLRHGRHEGWFPLADARATFHDRGSSALYGALDALRIGPGHRVLVPAYICADVVACLARRSVEVEYYAVRQDLRIDFDDLGARLATGDAKALLVVHYFGLPQDLDQLLAVKARHRALLIEDCAHAFLSRCGDVPLGSVGDCAVFSLRKTLPLAAGISVGAWARGAATTTVPGTPRREVRAIVKKLVGRAEFRLGRRFVTRPSVLVLGETQPELHPGSSPPGSPNSKPQFSLVPRLLAHLDFRSIVAKRRANYQFLASQLEDLDGVSMIERNLAAGVCPMAFPVLVRDRDNACKFLNARGIEAYPWPFLPASLGREWTDAHALAERMMLLPIHQDLVVRHLEYIAKCVRRACGQ